MKIKSSSSSLSLGSKTHTFGCISLILQRFLCSGTSSTYPSDQITESSFKYRDFSSASPRGRGDGPGAVVRLMGLDSVPVIDKTRVISRSPSVKSADHVKRDNDEIQGKHRRGKSTMDYVELEDDNFFILSFEKKRYDECFRELKQLETRKCKKKRETRENQTHVEGKENNINALNVSPGSEKLEIGELKQRRKEKRKNRRKRREIKLRENIQNEDWIKSNGCWSREGELVNCEDEDSGSCDDSSPVSVLDYDRLASSRVTPEPETSSRRRLSPELESDKRNKTIQEDQITSTSRSRECNVQHPRYQDMLPMICRLTLSELKGSYWDYRKASKVEDLEGIISKDIISNILDELLEETVTTLSLTSRCKDICVSQYYY